MKIPIDIAIPLATSLSVITLLTYAIVFQTSYYSYQIIMKTLAILLPIFVYFYPVSGIFLCLSLVFVSALLASFILL